MKKNHIVLKNVNLQYASAAYQDRSLKMMLIKRFGFKNNKVSLSDIHALKNINLTIQQGERVGLLGHNGAGKKYIFKDDCWLISRFFWSINCPRTNSFTI